MTQHTRFSQAIKLLNESFQQSLATLVTLHNKYLRSKDVKNVFQRYALLRDMIKVRINRLSAHYELG